MNPDVFDAPSDLHLDEYSQSSEPAAWDPPTGETLGPADPAATAPPAPVRPPRVRVHPALRPQSQRLTLGEALVRMPVLDVVVATMLGTALGVTSGGVVLLAVMRAMGI